MNFCCNLHDEEWWEDKIKKHWGALVSVFGVGFKANVSTHVSVSSVCCCCTSAALVWLQTDSCSFPHKEHKEQTYSQTQRGSWDKKPRKQEKWLQGEIWRPVIYIFRRISMSQQQGGRSWAQAAVGNNRLPHKKETKVFSDNFISSKKWKETETRACSACLHIDHNE